MRVKRLGIEWGAAFKEAQPIEVEAVGRKFRAFISEGYDLIIELPADAKIEVVRVPVEKSAEGVQIRVRLENGL